MRNWKKRWFVLTGDAIKYFTNPTQASGDAKPKGTVKMQTITHCMNVLAGGKDKAKASHTLEVGTEGGRIYYFRCANDNERAAWVKAVNDTMVAFFDSRGAGGGGGGGGQLTDGGYGGGGGGALVAYEE